MSQFNHGAGENTFRSLRAAIYCRVSTDRQEREGTSLESQRERCLRHASDNGYSIGSSHIYSEAASGTTWRDRPQLQAMLAAVRNGEVDVVIVYAFDRLSRKQVHTAVILDRLDEVGVRYESVTEEFDATPVGQFMRSAKAFAAEIENESRVERSVRGKYTRITKGKIHGHGTDLYGYRRDKDRGVRVIHEPESRVVRQIYDWVSVGGLSVRSVIRRLNDLGIPAPSESDGKRKYKDGRVCRWGRGTVHRILTEPAYKGETVLWRYKWRGSDRYREERPESDWVRLGGVTPEIVTAQQWQDVQLRLAVNTGSTARNEKRPYLLRGLIFCGHSGCGLPMRATPEHGRLVYRCASREKPSGPCGGKRAPATVVEAELWREIVASMSDPDRIAKEVDRLKASDALTELEAEKRSVLRCIAKIEREQEDYMRGLREQGANSRMWQLAEREIDRLEKERLQHMARVQELETQIAGHNAAISRVEGMRAYCAAVRANLQTLDFPAKRELLEALDIRVMADGRDWQASGGVPTEPACGIALRSS